jgi:hypothetical protein
MDFVDSWRAIRTLTVEIMRPTKCLQNFMAVNMEGTKQEMRRSSKIPVTERFQVRWRYGLDSRHKVARNVTRTSNKTTFWSNINFFVAKD